MAPYEYTIMEGIADLFEDIRKDLGIPTEDFYSDPTGLQPPPINVTPIKDGE